MQAELTILMLTAISISFLHTAAGPDHYLPFIALSKLRRWSPARTILWTIYVVAVMYGVPFYWDWEVLP